MIALLTALAVVLGSLFTVVELSEPIKYVDLYGNERYSVAAVFCYPNGESVLYALPTVSRLIVMHELAHAQDCWDDGLLNGSPGFPKPATRPSKVSDYCWYSDAEWYACAFVRSAR